MFNIDWGEQLIQVAIIIGIEAFVNNSIASPQEILMELALLIVASVGTKYIMQYLSGTEV